jgi:hypothetical protein
VFYGGDGILQSRGVDTYVVTIVSQFLEIGKLLLVLFDI